MKTFKFIYKTAAILLVCGLLQACTKPPKETEHLIDQETKDYCLFGQGSYWIYQDLATLERDSVVIDKIRYEIEDSKGFSKSTLENYLINISSYFQDSIHNIRVALGINFSKHCCLYFNYDVIYHNGKIMESNYDYRNTILVEKKNNYSVNGFIYSEVKVFKYSEYGIEKIFYWAKHIGVIRREIHNNNNGCVTINNLIKHNVKPYKEK